MSGRRTPGTDLLDVHSAEEYVSGGGTRGRCARFLCYKYNKFFFFFLFRFFRARSFLVTLCARTSGRRSRARETCSVSSTPQPPPPTRNVEQNDARATAGTRVVIARLSAAVLARRGVSVGPSIVIIVTATSSSSSSSSHRDKWQS